MKTKRLIQIVVSYSERDGIGSIVSGIHEVAQNKGILSSIFSLAGNPETTDPKLEKLKIIAEESLLVDTKYDTWFIYHFGSSNEFIESFINLHIPAKRCFYYHNVTPADFFSFWEPPLTRQLKKSRRNLNNFLKKDWILTGDSHFNISELSSFSENTFFPPVVPEYICRDLSKKIDFSEFSSRGAYASVNLLFVGRFVPNKKQDVLIYILSQLRKRNFPANLYLVGKGNGPYKIFLKLLTRLLGIKKFVHFREDLSQVNLETVYRHSNYLVVSSEHEGFCLPIFESLNRGLIPIARPITAMKELLKDTNLLASDQTINSFVEKIIDTINETWEKPEGYQKKLETSFDQIRKNFSTYLSTDQFLEQIYRV